MDPIVDQYMNGYCMFMAAAIHHKSGLPIGLMTVTHPCGVRHGKIFDVAVSPDGTVVSAELSEENHLVMYVPPFWGHGFLALEESVVVYGQTGLYSPTVEKTLKWDAFGIDWPIKENLILSEKDAKA